MTLFDIKKQNMKNRRIYAIKPRSIVDVITNSSSELFIVDSGEVKKSTILYDLINDNIPEGNYESYMFESGDIPWLCGDDYEDPNLWHLLSALQEFCSEYFERKLPEGLRDRLVVAADDSDYPGIYKTVPPEVVEEVRTCLDDIYILSYEGFSMELDEFLTTISSTHFDF